MALIEVISDSGTTLLDDEYSNACFAMKGTVTIQPSSNGVANSAQFSWTAQNSTDFPIMALGLTGYPAIQTHVSRSGNTWTWFCYFGQGAQNTSVTYYIFTVPSAVSNAGGLLQLFNAAGKLVFDSNLKYMRVDGFYSFPLADGSKSLAALTSGRTYAVSSVIMAYTSAAIETPPQQQTTDPFAQQMFGAMAFSTSGGNLTVQSLSVSAGYYQIPRADLFAKGNNTGAVMLVDVTGY